MSHTDEAAVEYEKDAANLIEMNPVTQETHLNPPPESAQSKVRGKVHERRTFTFDNSFWSIDRDDPSYADQEDVYNALGQEFLDHNFQGYHTCIFAYGQTGSGKSYSMMGTPDHPGLIPRTCRDLFERIEANNSPNVTFTVRVSYFEVYNEHVRDLLNPREGPAQYLKVRESPTDGPYIKDLTEVPVRGITEVLKWMKMGDKSRTTAATNMNDTSSRSHAVFTLVLKQIECTDGDETTERVARIRYAIPPYNMCQLAHFIQLGRSRRIRASKLHRCYRSPLKGRVQYQQVTDYVRPCHCRSGR